MNIEKTVVYTLMDKNTNEKVELSLIPEKDNTHSVKLYLENAYGISSVILSINMFNEIADIVAEYS